MEIVRILGKILGDVPTATAILDRFLYYPEIVTITGKGYRLKDHAMTSREAKTPISGRL
ncbi:ATP-binding protein [Aporhodopirellula aestuarii]|uniref:ATP-binding protein n=1 Tax=Aporhodopirellula aestuarii TaxID=2950107 RepID=A0ABT0U4U2_9BACT|nr:ATP-binding protein [Aporhodopirellula aestuarii]MCM2371871.1 ATP-binding protein [Aporhodopirellula aestuarii]